VGTRNYFPSRSSGLRRKREKKKEVESNNETHGPSRDHSPRIGREGKVGGGDENADAEASYRHSISISLFREKGETACRRRSLFPPLLGKRESGALYGEHGITIAIRGRGKRREINLTASRWTNSRNVGKKERGERVATPDANLFRWEGKKEKEEILYHKHIACEKKKRRKAPALRSSSIKKAGRRKESEAYRTGLVSVARLQHQREEKRGGERGRFSSF